MIRRQQTYVPGEHEPMKYMLYRRCGVGVLTAYFLSNHNNMHKCLRMMERQDDSFDMVRAVETASAVLQSARPQLEAGTGARDLFLCQSTV